MGAALTLPVFGLLVPSLPLICAGATVIFVVMIAAVVSPGGFIAVTGVLSSAIPKAGVVVGGFPLPVMMFALLLVGLLLRWRADESRAERRGTRIGVVALAWLIYRLVMMHLDGGDLGQALALAGWYALPIVLLLVGPAPGSLRGDRGAQWVRYLESGLIFACGFSVVQQLGGIERTALPGVTRAIGADYSQKPLAFAGGSKIPSTYQNGNILGVVTAFFFLVAADRVLRGRGRRRDTAILGATAVASVLSGSRTVLIGLGVGMGVLILRSGLNRRTVAICVLAIAAFTTVLSASPALSRRITGTKASDPALAIRTLIWKQVIRETSVAEGLIGGSVWAQRRLDPGLGEGMIGAVQQVGIVGMVLFISVFMTATSSPEMRRWRIFMIPIGISLLVDSAYLVFPTMFLPIARMFAPLTPDSEPPQTHVPVTASDGAELPA